MNKLMQLLGILVFSFATWAYQLFVFTKVWGYIAVKMFHLNPITFWEAFAIGQLLSIFTADYNRPTEKDTDKLPGRIATTLLGLTLSWGIAYWIFG